MNATASYVRIRACFIIDGSERGENENTAGKVAKSHFTLMREKPEVGHER